MFQCVRKWNYNIVIWSLCLRENFVKRLAENNNRENQQIISQKFSSKAYMRYFLKYRFN